MRIVVVFVLVQFSVCCLTASAQDLKPGLPGMAPVKWITIRNTQAPGRVYQSLNSNARTYTQEETYFKVWIPFVVKPAFALAVAPHYRTEVLEGKGASSEVDQLAGWKLRSMGLDLKSYIRLDSSSWLINTANVSQSGNLNDHGAGNVPLTYTFSSVFLRKRSSNKEIGFGFMINKSNSLMVLPVFIYNYNFSARNGIEISLPHKIAWRHNLTPRDIFYVKAEANTRSYFISNPSAGNFDLFRRIDADMGVAYNRQFTSFMGAEVFAGYRQNLSYDVPENISVVRNSGLVASFEIYIKVPQGLHFNRRK